MAAKPFARHGDDILLKRGFLAFVVIIFYCNIGIYLSLAVSPRVEPQYWLGLVVLLACVWAIFSSRHRLAAFNTPLFFWCLLFSGLTVILFVAIPASHVSEVKERIRDVISLTVLLWIFLMMRDQIAFLRKLVLAAVLLGVAINLVSVIYRNFIDPVKIVNAGRAAGFYINPNESATAIIAGMIISIGILSKPWRALFSSIVLVGVVVTYSREAILSWIIVVLAFCILGIVDWKKLLFWLSVFMIIAILIVFILIKINAFGELSASRYTTQIHRLLFTNGAQHGTSMAIRLTLLKESWELYLRHPLLGNGIGSTEHWGLPYSTHNIYLYYMDDYGLIGLFLYPLLVWCIFYESVGETRKIAWCMAIFLLFWGLFDHDTVRNYYALFLISLMAAMSRISRHADAFSK
ncbi:MAG: O-antigen ligase family protein [Gammaproteobacteria bacterium]